MRPRQHHRKVEAGALAGFALDPKPAAHEPRQPRADGQSESGAPVIARGRAVDLREGVENQLVLVLRDADAGVRHGELERTCRTLRRARLNPDGDLALGGELDGVAHQIDDDLPQSVGIAPHELGYVAPQIAQQLEALLVGPQREGPQGRMQAFRQIEIDDVELVSARLDLGKIEHIVDDAEQAVRRQLHGIEHFPLLQGQRRFQREIGHADDAVERGAHFMAHVRQEFALCAIRRLGRLLGVAQDLLGLDALAHIEEGHHRADDGVAAVDRPRPAFRQNAHAVLAPHRIAVHVGGFAAVQRRVDLAFLHGRWRAGVLAVVDHGVHVPAEQFIGGRVAEHLQAGGVAESGVALVVDPVDRLRRPLQQQPHQLAVVRRLQMGSVHQVPARVGLELNPGYRRPRDFL